MLWALYHRSCSRAALELRGVYPSSLIAIHRSLDSRQVSLDIDECGQHMRVNT